jgi:hypothetical protein
VRRFQWSRFYVLIPTTTTVDSFVPWWSLNAMVVFDAIGDVTTTMLWINNQSPLFPLFELFSSVVRALLRHSAFLVRQVMEDETQSRCLKSLLSPRPTGLLVWYCMFVMVPAFAEFTGVSATMYTVPNALYQQPSNIMKLSSNLLV